MRQRRQFAKERVCLFLCICMLIQSITITNMPLTIEAASTTSQDEVSQTGTVSQDVTVPQEDVSSDEMPTADDEDENDEGKEDDEGVLSVNQVVSDHTAFLVSGNSISVNEVDESLGTVTVTNDEAKFRFVCKIDNKINPSYFTVTSSTYIGTEAGYVFTGIPASLSWAGNEYPVTCIPDELCYKNKKITKVDLAQTSIKSIKNRSFKECTNIQEVILPQGIETVGNEAFRTLGSLKTLILPNSLKSIGVYAFSGCSALEKVGNNINAESGILKLPTSLETIGSKAFWSGSDKLSKVFIPKSLSAVDTPYSDAAGPFYDRVFEVIQFEEGIQQIPNCLFLNEKEKTQLTQIHIPASVTTIGRDAFRRQIGLTEVTFDANSKLTEVGEAAFRTCSNLDEIHLPNSVLTIDEYAFSGCDITKFGSNISGNMVLPEKLETLGGRAFWGNDDCTSIIIPSTLSNVPNYEGYGPFHDCSRVETIQIKEGMQKLPQHLFAGNCGIEIDAVTGNGVQIILPESLTQIDSWAFKKNTRIAEIAIPDKVTKIGTSAFEGASNLKDLTITQNSALQTIGDYAFLDCGKLESFDFPASLTRIGSEGFKNCASFTQLWIPKTFTELGYSAFEGCTGLSKIDYEVHNEYTSEQKIGSRCFYGCISLNDVDLGNRIKGLPEKVFGNCTALSEIAIPYGVTKVEEKAFYKCKNLQIMFVPSSVTTFGTTSTEFERSYQHEPKVYVEKGDSIARTKAEGYGWNVEVGIYAVNDEVLDVKFRNYIKDAGIDHNIDTRLTIRELEPVVSLDVSALGVKDMTGIELFVNLEELDCSNNLVEELDIDTLIHLKELNCADNRISSLDLENNPLETLDCGDNCILAINLSQNDKLTNVVLGNQTGSMGTDKNIYGEYILALKRHYADYAKKNVSQLTDASAAAVDVGLSWNDAYDVPEQIGYQYTTTYGTEDTEATLAATITITNAGIVLSDEQYPDMALRSKLRTLLDTNRNGLVSKDEERLCTQLDVSDTEIVDMTGISRLPNLSILRCSSAKITTLPLEQNSKLTELSCRYNQLSELDVSFNTQLKKLDCRGNRLRSLDISDNRELTELICEENRIKVLDTLMNTKLEVLQIGNNEIAALNVSGNQAIDTLRAGNQSVDIVREPSGHDYLANMKEYNTDFMQGNVSNIKTYSDGTEISQQDSGLRVTESGFTVSEAVDTICYEYTISDKFKNMSVSVNLLDYPKDDEEAEEAVWDVTIKEIADQTYTGDEIKPALSVKLGSHKLLLDRDYTVSYRNHIETGVAAAKVTGIGDYTKGGSQTIYFNIVECPMNKVTVSIPSQTYNASYQTPEPVVTYRGHKLEQGTDYLLAYSKHKNAGRGIVVFNGIGNFKGTYKKTFQIQKLNLETLRSEEVSVSESVAYRIIGAKPDVSLKCNGELLVLNKDYQIFCKNNKKLGTATVTIKGIKNCTGAITRNYAVTAVPLSDPSVQIEIAPAQKDKNNKAISPKIKIMQGGKKLSAGERKDYVISYNAADTTHSGAVTVTIEGKNKYTGVMKRDFVIVDQMITKAKVQGLKAFEYDGSSIEQDEKNITLMMGKSEIPADCYEISYSDNEKAGKATVTFTAQPQDCNYEYGGVASFKFNISKVKFVPKKNQQRVTAELTDTEMEYTGDERKPEVVVTDKVLGTELMEGTDYKLRYKNAVNVGTKAAVTITGIGSYQGSIKLSYGITARDLTEHADDIEIRMKNSAYTGKTIVPRLTVKDNGRTLSLNKDYTLSFAKVPTGEDLNKIKDRGRYRVSIIGKGNYKNECNHLYLKIY